LTRSRTGAKRRIKFHKAVPWGMSTGRMDLERGIDLWWPVRVANGMYTSPLRYTAVASSGLLDAGIVSTPGWQSGSLILARW
jgi:hypothetical protein